MTLRYLLLLLCLNGVFHLLAQEQNDSASTPPDSTASNQQVAQVTPADITVITAPEGFEKSETVNGYVQSTTGTSIVVSQITGVNYINMGKSMSDAYFHKNDIALVERNELLTDSGDRGLVFKTTLRSKEIDFTRYFVYVGGANNTIWISITHPSEYEELVAKDIEKCIQSVNLKNRTK